jgi:uncharacterized membrane protein
MGYSLSVKKFLPIIGIILFLILAAIPSVYFYRKYQTLQKQVNVTETKDDIAALMARVGKHILLPQGETPTVMTVTDKEKLSGQTFFANAKNGDKVLIYEKAKKAFLYNPVTDRVIEVGPVVTASVSGAIASPTAAVTNPATPSAAPQIIIQ